jgi:hypothetical protein
MRCERKDCSAQETTATTGPRFHSFDRMLAGRTASLLDVQRQIKQFMIWVTRGRKNRDCDATLSGSIRGIRRIPEKVRNRPLTRVEVMRRLQGNDLKG